jgi:hypothetical protein
MEPTGRREAPPDDKTPRHPGGPFPHLPRYTDGRQRPYGGLRSPRILHLKQTGCGPLALAAATT